MELQDSGETAGPASRTDGTTRGGRRVGRVRRDESGLVLVWTALFLMVLLGFAALAVDLGHSYYVGQKEQDAADAAALAGAIYLPGDVASAQATAQEIAATNGFTDGTDGVSVSAVQDPGNPSQLLVTVHQTLSTWFGAAIGFRSMDVSKSATGIASETSTTKPVDMVLILDRTQSMNAQDLQAVKDASGALLETLDPATDSVALGVTGPSLTTKQCGNGAYGLGPPTIATDPSMTWIAAPWPNGPLLTDYQTPDGNLNSNSQLVKTINCLNTSKSNTNLGDPLTAAKNYLATYGRPGAEQDIILMTDGAANKPDGTQPCEYANDAATVGEERGHHDRHDRLRPRRHLGPAEPLPVRHGSRRSVQGRVRHEAAGRDGEPDQRRCCDRRPRLHRRREHRRRQLLLPAEGLRRPVERLRQGRGVADEHRAPARQVTVCGITSRAASSPRRCRSRRARACWQSSPRAV